MLISGEQNGHENVIALSLLMSLSAFGASQLQFPATLSLARKSVYVARFYGRDSVSFTCHVAEYRHIAPYFNVIADKKRRNGAILVFDILSRGAATGGVRFYARANDVKPRSSRVITRRISVGARVPKCAIKHVVYSHLCSGIFGANSGRVLRMGVFEVIWAIFEARM